MAANSQGSMAGVHSEFRYKVIETPSFRDSLDAIDLTPRWLAWLEWLKSERLAVNPTGFRYDSQIDLSIAKSRSGFEVPSVVIYFRVDATQVKLLHAERAQAQAPDNRQTY